MELNFRTLRADEIDVRFGNNVGSSNFTLLLYKDARADMSLLDEVVGPLNWQREHIIRENVIKGNRTMVNYCKVSIWDTDKNCWVSKEDVGTESMAENAKGESSDAFKRACVNFGIGRELYTSPYIKIDNKYRNDNFYVKEIGCDENKSIIKLVISSIQSGDVFTFQKKNTGVLIETLNDKENKENKKDNNQTDKNTTPNVELTLDIIEKNALSFGTIDDVTKYLNENNIDIKSEQLRGLRQKLNAKFVNIK